MTAFVEFLNSIPGPLQLLLTAIVSVIGTAVVTMGKLWSVKGSVEENARAKFRTDLMERVLRAEAGHDKCNADLVEMQRRLNQAESRISVLSGSNEVMKEWVAFFQAQTGSMRSKPTPDDG